MYLMFIFSGEFLRKSFAGSSFCLLLEDELEEDEGNKDLLFSFYLACVRM
jgi:hypothetical protein